MATTHRTTGPTGSFTRLVGGPPAFQTNQLFVSADGLRLSFRRTWTDTGGQ